MIRHAGLLLTAPAPVIPLSVAVVEPAFRALLVAGVGAPPLLPAGLCAAPAAAIAMSAIAVGADEEHGVALLTETDSLKENRFAVSLRHASSQAGLDNGTRFVAGWNQLCLVYLTKVAGTRNPTASNGRVPSLHAFADTITSCGLLGDDGTDDCACGADDVGAQAQKSTISDDR